MLERDLERGLIEHLRALILELGKGCKTACKTFQIPGVNSAQKFPPWPCDDPAFPLENLGCCSWT
jgi:hypothetical protein